MKKQIILLNLLVLLLGNTLFESIHYLHEHSNHSFLEENECIDCIFYNNDDDIIKFNTIIFSDNCFSQLFLDNIIPIDYSNDNFNHCRAPPISS